MELHKYDSSGVYMNDVLAGGILGVSLLVCGVVSDVMGGFTGLPGRPCGRHKMAVSLLSAADVKWLGMEMPQCLDELECQVKRL